MSKPLALAALASVTALIVGSASYVYYASSQSAYADCNSVAMVGNADLGGAFTLVSETGETVTDKDVITGPTLMYFGYTYCPDVCPLDVVRNVEAVDILAERGLSLKPVFVSVDHIRDTPETIDDFTANMHPQLLGLTGSEQQIRDVARSFRYVFDIQDPEDEFTLINHMTLSYLMKPEEGFVAAFDRALSGDQLADDLACYLTH